MTGADDQTEVGSYFIANYPPFFGLDQRGRRPRREAGAGGSTD